MSDLTHRWANAAQTLVLRSDGASIPADPANSDFAAINLEDVAPFQRFATLDAAKSERLAELAHRRWLAEQAFNFNGSPLALDDGTQRRIAGAIQYLSISNEPSVRWQVARGVFTTLSAAQLTGLGIAAGAHVQACFARVETLAAEIEAAPSIDAVEAVDIEQGWP